MELSDESIQELKQIINNSTDRKLTDEESKAHGEAWVGFFQLLWEIDQRNKERDKKSDQDNNAPDK